MAILLTVDKKRKGNEADVERLLPLLDNWGYSEVINKRDPTRQDMVDTLRDLQKRDNIHSVNNAISNCPSQNLHSSLKNYLHRCSINVT